MSAPLLSEAKHRGVALWLDGDRLRYRAPACAVTPELRQSLAASRAYIRDRLMRVAATPVRLFEVRCKRAREALDTGRDRAGKKLGINHLDKIRELLAETEIDLWLVSCSEITPESSPASEPEPPRQTLLQ